MKPVEAVILKSTHPLLATHTRQPMSYESFEALALYVANQADEGEGLTEVHVRFDSEENLCCELSLGKKEFFGVRDYLTKVCEDLKDDEDPDYEAFTEWFSKIEWGATH